MRCLAAFAMSCFSCVCAASLGDADGRKVEYVFVPDKVRVLLDRFPFYYEGYLNDAGGFVPDPKAPPVQCKVEPEKRWRWLNDLQKQKFPIYNWAKTPTPEQSVYQFIGGEHLILGSLTQGWDGFAGGGDFFPFIERDQIKVISMGEYLKTYDPMNHIRIYNLPGRIVEKGKAGAKEKSDR